MTPKRRPQIPRPPKPPSPPPPPPAESSDDEDLEEGDVSENASQQSDSEASDDEKSGEDDSKSEQDQPIPKPLPSPATPIIASSAADGKARVDSLETDSKGNSAPPEGTPSETSKKSFRRVWSDDDQLALLSGMIDFIELKGKDPITNIEDFWLFVRKLISFPVTESQLVVKIRSLRFKFRDSEGKDKVFTKSSEAKAFLLWRKIWGTEDKKVVVENGGKAGARKREDAGDNKGPRHHSPDKAESFSLLTHEMVNLCRQNVGLSGSYVRARINEADEYDLKLLEERWKKQKLEEVTVIARMKVLQADILRAMMR